MGNGVSTPVLGRKGSLTVFTDFGRTVPCSVAPASLSLTTRQVRPNFSKLLAMGKTYAEKLKDPRWQRKRLEIFQRDGFMCMSCTSEGETLHVHHRYYEKGLDPWDYTNEALVTLCEGCHERVTKLMSRLGAVLAPKDYLNLFFLITALEEAYAAGEDLCDIVEKYAGVTPT